MEARPTEDGMRKEEIMALRERVLREAAKELERRHLPPLRPDPRLYAHEAERELLWIDRLVPSDAWPHAGYGGAGGALPGLRYEAWYFQKRETVLLALVCSGRPVLEPLASALAPVWRAFVEEGRYARRYRSIDDRSPDASLIAGMEPGSQGIWRGAPQSEAKLAAALGTLVSDTYSRVNQIVRSVDPGCRLPEQYREAAEQRDPIGELQARFGQRRTERR